MNNINDQFPLAEHMSMRKKHLGQLRFTYSACIHFAKTKQLRKQNKNKKFKETGDLRYKITFMDINMSCHYFIFNKKSRDTNTYNEAGIVSEDQQLVNKLHRPINK